MSPESTETTTPCQGLSRVSAPERLPRFSEELDRLLAAFEERSVKLRDVLEVIHSRGYTVLLIVLAFPFCTPLPTPVVSIPFGFVIAFIGMRLALGMKPWLPARLMDTSLPPRFFPRLLRATRLLVRGLEYLLRPRLAHLVRWGPVRRAMGAMILTCGLLLMLPLPIPFSNGLPAFSVLLLASAMLEEDGYFLVAGTVSFLVAVMFFTALAWGGTELAEIIGTWFGDWLKPDDASGQL
ncbi:MAG TPA: exopolysaccharide biosynthesis protein [Verrucomicrobia bacterium]|nr:exopolysaccharide biosynthesis protein [Verrucomicrobiota bacterium]